MESKKIKKVRVNKYTERLQRLMKCERVNSNYVVDFGEFKGWKIRSLIIVNFRYVQWCIESRIFDLDSELQALLTRIVNDFTYDESETDTTKHKDLPWD